MSSDTDCLADQAHLVNRGRVEHPRTTRVERTVDESMRKATICVGGILCLGLAALAGVHMYESAATKHADAATTTVPRTVNATVTPVNETRGTVTAAELRRRRGVVRRVALFVKI